MIKLNETFYSIQGESTYAGLPTFFIRTTGCNLRCTYCDTKYSYYEGELISIDELVQKTKDSGARYVCITGGEPLLQSEVYELMRKLCDDGFKVSLETSGSKSIAKVDPRVKVILDVKTPDSGAADSFEMENLNHLQSHTELKFVISSQMDFEWAEDFCRQHNLRDNFTILYSPDHEKIEAQWLAKIILTKNSTARLQLQQHKYIWSSQKRGV